MISSCNRDVMCYLARARLNSQNQKPNAYDSPPDYFVEPWRISTSTKPESHWHQETSVMLHPHCMVSTQTFGAITERADVKVVLHARTRLV